MEKLSATVREWLQIISSKSPLLASLPVFSLALAMTCLTAGLVVQVGYGPLLREARDAHYEAARLTAREPLIKVSYEQMPVVRAVNPMFENDTLLEFMLGQTDHNAIEMLQAQFDTAASTATTSLNAHPFRQMGIVPAATSPATLVTHAFVHSGVLHLLGSIFLLLLAAPLLERRWGGPLLALHSVVVIAASGVVYAFVQADSHRALVGTSALVAAMVAAVLVHYKGDDIDFLAWTAPIKEFELIAPVWLLVATWAVYEGALWFITQSSLPLGADNAVGYSAHACGFVLGAGMALLLDKLGVNKPAVVFGANAAGSTTRVKPISMDRINALKAKGDDDGAYVLLRAEVERSARNRDIVMAYWTMAIARDEADQAAPILLKLVEEEMRRGASPVVPQYWKHLHDKAPDVLLDAATLVRLSPAIEKEFGEPGVQIVLGQLLGEKMKGLTGELTARAARMAVEVDIRLATIAAKRAANARDLDETTRSEMKMLAAALAPNKPQAYGEEQQHKKTAPAASAFFEESDRSAFGEVADLSGIADESFPENVISEVVPVAVSGAGLSVKNSHQVTHVIAFDRMRAMAVVGVHGVAEKPIVLLDLVIDGGGDSAPLSVLRIRCDHFNPRTLVPKAQTSKDALRAIVRGLGKQRLRVLADITAPTPGTKPVFESLDAYHEKILRPIGSEFA